MKEKFLMDLIGCYREYFPENIPVECRKTAALIVFRFAYILLHQDLPLSEVRYGLTDARQQSRTRIRNTKKGEQFVAEHMQRIERINRNLLLLSEEIQAGEDSHNI